MIQVLTGLVFALGSFFLCKLLNRQIALAQGPPQFLLPADSFFWGFLSLFGALTLLWELTYRLWCLFDADAANAYVAYSDDKTGFGVTRVLRWMTVLVTFPIAIFTVLCLPIHASFYQDGFWLGRFSQFRPEFHAYKSVRTFRLIDGETIRDGSFSARPRVVLTFQDGTVWDSFRTREDRPANPQLIAYLTSKLGRAPEHMKTDPL